MAKLRNTERSISPAVLIGVVAFLFMTSSLINATHLRSFGSGTDQTTSASDSVTTVATGQTSSFSFSFSRRGHKCLLSTNSSFSAAPVQWVQCLETGRNTDSEVERFVMDKIPPSKLQLGDFSFECPNNTKISQWSATFNPPTVVQIRNVKLDLFLASEPASGPALHGSSRPLIMTTTPYYFCAFLKTPLRIPRSGTRILPKNGAKLLLTTLQAKTGYCNNGYDFLMMKPDQASGFEPRLFPDSHFSYQAPPAQKTKWSKLQITLM